MYVTGNPDHLRAVMDDTSEAAVTCFESYAPLRTLFRHI